MNENHKTFQKVVDRQVQQGPYWLQSVKKSGQLENIQESYKNTKRSFFDTKIQEVADKSHSP